VLAGVADFHTGTAIRSRAVTVVGAPMLIAVRSRIDHQAPGPLDHASVRQTAGDKTDARNRIRPTPHDREPNGQYRSAAQGPYKAHQRVDGFRCTPGRRSHSSCMGRFAEPAVATQANPHVGVGPSNPIREMLEVVLVTGDTSFLAMRSTCSRSFSGGIDCMRKQTPNVAMVSSRRVRIVGNKFASVAPSARVFEVSAELAKEHDTKSA
jgi:hypothetical protein